MKKVLIFANLTTLVLIIMHVLLINILGTSILLLVSIIFNLVVLILLVMYFRRFSGDSVFLLSSIAPIISIAFIIYFPIMGRAFINPASEAEARTNLYYLASLEEEYKAKTGEYLPHPENPKVMHYLPVHNHINVNWFGGRLSTHDNWGKINFNPSNNICLWELPEYRFFSIFRKGFLPCDGYFRFQYSVEIKGAYDFLIKAKSFHDNGRPDEMVTLDSKGNFLIEDTPSSN